MALNREVWPETWPQERRALEAIRMMRVYLDEIETSLTTRGRVVERWRIKPQLGCFDKQTEFLRELADQFQSPGSAGRDLRNFIENEATP